MSGTRYTEEFKMAAVRQVVDKGYPVLEVSARLGVTNRTLYAWLRKYDMPIQDHMLSFASRFIVVRACVFFDKFDNSARHIFFSGFFNTL